STPPQRALTSSTSPESGAKVKENLPSEEVMLESTAPWCPAPTRCSTTAAAGAGTVSVPTPRTALPLTSTGPAWSSRASAITELPSGAGVPTGEVHHLLVGELVDVHTHGPQLELGDLGVDLGREPVHRVGEIALLGHEMGRGQGL